MRLSSSQIEAIKQETEHFFGAQAEVRLFGSHEDKHQRGFTLVELIMTMVIIGIIAAVAAPRFFDVNVFESRGFADEVKASLRFAQKTAIAQRHFVCVAFAGNSTTNPNSVTLTIDKTTDPSAAGAVPTCPAPPATTCSAPAVPTCPAASPTCVLTMGNVQSCDASFDTTPTSFYFNALGTPTNAPQTISITGATSSITIEAETGYVH